MMMGNLSQKELEQPLGCVISKFLATSGNGSLRFTESKRSGPLFFRSVRRLIHNCDIMPLVGAVMLVNKGFDANPSR
jgi:hypothetical protein